MDELLNLEKHTVIWFKVDGRTDWYGDEREFWYVHQCIVGDEMYGGIVTKKKMKHPLIKRDTDIWSMRGIHGPWGWALVPIGETHTVDESELRFCGAKITEYKIIEKGRGKANVYVEFEYDLLPEILDKNITIYDNYSGDFRKCDMKDLKWYYPEKETGFALRPVDGLVVIRKEDYESLSKNIEDTNISQNSNDHCP